MSAKPNTLRVRHLAALDVIRRFLDLDDWTDEQIAPAALIRDARTLSGPACGSATADPVLVPARSIGTYLVASTNGTVLDEPNGLEWQASDDSTRRSFKDAEAYCAQLSLAGRSDWRLPTEEELLSLVDRKAYKPAINGGLFPGTKSEFYWSSTPVADYPADCAWGVHFLNGNTRFYFRDDTGFVRAVRSVSPAAPGQ